MWTGTFRERAVSAVLGLLRRASTRDRRSVYVERLTGTAWVCDTAREPEQRVRAKQFARQGWFVSVDRSSARADLKVRTQALQFLGQQHVAWLLERYRVDCVLDVGANTGQFAAELRRHGYRGHIASFEPVPVFGDALEEKAARDGNWTVHRLALGREDGTIRLRVQRKLTSALTANEYGRAHFRALSTFADSEPIEVPLRRLDSILDRVLAPLAERRIEQPRLFLKMDTQGFDLEVFGGLGNRSDDIVALQSEVSLLPIYEHMPRMPEAVAIYESAGFAISGMFPVTMEQSGRVIEYDCVMVRADTVG